MKTSSRTLIRAERTAAALDLRRRGMTYAEIAAQTGLSIGGAFDVVRRAIDARNRECAEQAAAIVALECDRLDGLFAGSFPAACGGDPAAVASCLRVMERRARLLGLDRAATARLDVGFRRGPEYFSDAELEAIVAGKPDGGDGGPAVI